MKKKSLTLLLVLSVCIAACFAESISLSTGKSSLNDLATVNKLDAFFAKPYNKNLDIAGTVFEYTSLAAPGILVFEDVERYPEIAIMYAETLAVTYFAKEVIKNIVKRQRPYTYFEGAPEEEKADWNKSMPSGHTASAFAGASFASYVFCKYNPTSKYKIPVIATCSALAVTTAVLRVSAGCHFVTDVLAGAAIGTVIGIGIPMLHTIGKNTESYNGPQVGVSPFGLLIKLDF